jgi:hypothetical protein
VAHHALVPFTFRIQVSHQTQEPPSEFLPAAPGIQQGASRRIGFADDSARDHANEGHTHAQFLSLDDLVVSSTGI